MGGNTLGPFRKDAISGGKGDTSSAPIPARNLDGAVRHSCNAGRCGA